MYLFNDCIDDGALALWSAASVWLELDKITGFKTDDAAFLTFSADEIRARQDLFRDIADNPGITGEFSDLIGMINDLEEVRRQAVIYSSKTTEQALYTIRSFSLIFEAVEKIGAIAATYGGKIRSARLKEFFAGAEKFRKEKTFAEDREYIDQTAQGVDCTRSMTLCVNLDAKLEPYEVGVMEIHDKPFVATSFFTGMLGDRSSSQIRHISPLVPASGSAAVKEAVYRYLNSGISKSLRKKTESMTGRMSRYIEYLGGICSELSFLIRADRFMSEIKGRCKGLTYPEISGGFHTEGLYSEKLLVRGQGEVVPNDVKCSPGRRMCLLTGANNGGKSIFINMVGVTQILFQLGLPVPASRSEMKIVKKLFCHFPNTATDRDSRFVDECRRMKKIVDSLDGDALLLMDESFSSTGDDEGTEVASSVLGSIEKIGAYCFFSTHLHALGNLVRDGSLPMEPMAIRMDGDTPTYRIEYGKIDYYSHAMRIAKKFDLV